MMGWIRNTTFLLVILLLSACKVTTPNIESSLKIPEKWTGTTARTDSANINWKAFFKDAYLIGLIDTALKNNPDLGLAVQRVEISRMKVNMNKSILLPQVNAEATSGIRRFSDYSIDGVGNYDTNLSENIGEDRRIPSPTPEFFLGLRSTWELDLWGKLRNRRKAAYNRYLASEMGVRLVKTLLVSEVARLYYELLALDNELEVIDKNIQLQETAVEMISVQKMGGRATELAVKQFTAQLLNTRARKAQVRQNLAATENQLNLLLGRFPQKIPRGKPINEQSLPTEISTGIPSRILLNRPDIKAAEYELASAKADLKAARAAFYPSFIISSSAGLHAFKARLLFDAPESVVFGILGGLTAPVFNRVRIKSNYNQAISFNRIAVVNYQKTILTGYSEVQNSLWRIENYRQMANIKEKEVEVLNQAVAISNDLFLAGFASYLEVVTAQKNALEAELELTNTKKEQFLSTIYLYKALGGGWE